MTEALPRLNIVIASTRPNRIGFPVAKWFQQAALQHAGFDVHIADLLEFALPVYDEPHHPKLRKYVHEDTKRWSKSVSAADAFVFVMPEYNYGTPPALVNALNYVYNEWNFKPCAFVSYGGVSGGIRAVQMTKQIVTTLKLVPIFEAVVIPFVAQQIKDGTFTPAPLQDEAATLLLTEMRRWALALRPLRTG
jgi:NAD(P)H-dependent FMN reductase